MTVGEDTSCCQGTNSVQSLGRNRKEPPFSTCFPLVFPRCILPRAARSSIAKLFASTKAMGPALWPTSADNGELPSIDVLPKMDHLTRLTIKTSSEHLKNLKNQESLPSVSEYPPVWATHQTSSDHGLCWISS